MDPSFFKPLVGDFTQKLVIPSAFLEKMGGKLASRLVLKYECERLYSVKIKELKDGHGFVNGWPEFVKDHGLEYGDFVVFRLVEDSTFQVTIYDPSMCEKQCCDSHLNTNGEGTATKKIKVEATTILDSDEDHPNGPSLTKKNQESAIKIESDSSDDELKGACSETDAPSFTLLLNEANKIYVPLPPPFVRETGLAKKKEVKVKDPNGKKWVVNITKDGKRVGLARGWTGFFAAHRLKKGDSCIFKYLSRGGVGLIQVDVKRGRGRPPKKQYV